MIENLDTTYYFDDALRDVPNNPSDMQKAVEVLIHQTQQPQDDATLIQTYGFLGSYARTLGQFNLAEEVLQKAIELSKKVEDHRNHFVNRTRLAHVYQWQKDFSKSDALFDELLTECEQPEFERIKDFIYQHAGKNLFDQGKFSDALKLFEAALALRQAKENQSLIDSTQHAIDITKRKLKEQQAS